MVELEQSATEKVCNASNPASHNIISKGILFGETAMSWGESAAETNRRYYEEKRRRDEEDRKKQKRAADEKRDKTRKERAQQKKTAAKKKIEQAERDEMFEKMAEKNKKYLNDPFSSGEDGKDKSSLRRSGGLGGKSRKGTRSPGQPGMPVNPAERFNNGFAAGSRSAKEKESGGGKSQPTGGKSGLKRGF